MAKKNTPPFERFKQLLLLVFIAGGGYLLQGKLHWQPLQKQVENVLKGEEVNLGQVVQEMMTASQKGSSKSHHKTSHKTTAPEGYQGSDIGGECALNLLNNQAPIIGIEKMAKESKEICNQAFAGRASFISKSSLYSAEYLTKDRILKAKEIERVNPFHQDERLASYQTATLEDYRSSGYDRGHLAPNADMPNIDAQYQSFSMANMIPQLPEHNRKTWNEVEQITRRLVFKYGSLYAVTIPVYQNAKGQLSNKIKTIGKSRVYVPNFVAKALYVPKINQAVVILTPHDESHRLQTLSLAQFEQFTQMDVFPSLSPQIKQRKGSFFRWNPQW